MNKNILRSPRLPSAAAVGLVGALMLGGCTSAENSYDVPQAMTTAIDSSSQAPQIRFDNNGGSSSVIKTYRGPGTSDFDRQETGLAYENGTTEPVDCIIEGRPVSPLPGEWPIPSSSTLWFRMTDKSAGYATAIYAGPEPIGVDIPDC